MLYFDLCLNRCLNRPCEQAVSQAVSQVLPAAKKMVPPEIVAAEKSIEASLQPYLTVLANMIRQVPSPHIPSRPPEEAHAPPFSDLEGL